MKEQIVVTGDQLLICALLGNFLSQHDFVVAGSYIKIQETLAHISRDPPDAVIVDARRSTQNGAEQVLMIKNEFPDQKIIILASSQEAKDLIFMLKNKINGYLLKSTPPNQLVQDVIAVCKGETRIAPELMGIVVDFVRNDNDMDRVSEGALTMREKEIMHLIAQGNTNKEIAEQLFISPNTVKNHVKSILSKLSLHSRTQAVSYWSGLVSRHGGQKSNLI
jgi:two-component system NarL family response regulator